KKCVKIKQQYSTKYHHQMRLNEKLHLKCSKKYLSGCLSLALSVKLRKLVTSNIRTHLTCLSQ
ncbi:hypothetical protein N9O92_01905, partial [Amylibacter sp.]|nr:hypothetical protein [Amylibacter sp.]